LQGVIKNHIWHYKRNKIIFCTSKDLVILCAFL
jgi:hypothetical protein